MTAPQKLPGTIAVLIERDVMTHVPKDVWPWELPILQAKWPGRLSVGAFKPATAIPDAFADTEGFPDAEDEFARLEKIYGITEDTKSSFVSEAYGRGQAGIDRLAEAIEASWEPPKPRVSRRAAAAEAASDKPETKPSK